MQEVRRIVDNLINYNVPLDQTFEYELYSGSFKKGFELTIFASNGKHYSAFIERTLWLDPDSAYVPTEEKMQETILAYIKDVEFERVVLMRV